MAAAYPPDIQTLAGPYASEDPPLDDELRKKIYAGARQN